MSAHSSCPCPSPSPVTMSGSSAAASWWTRWLASGLNRVAGKEVPASEVWQLEPGRAISLRLRHAGVLQVLSGPVWATRNGPSPSVPLDIADSASRDSGDFFLQSGQLLAVAPGEHWVLEAAFKSGGGLAHGLLTRNQS